MENDTIVKINSQKINSTADVLDAIRKDNQGFLNLTINRSNQIIETKVDVVTTASNERSIGLYIKDKVIGIGTMTFYSEDELHFGALAHPVITAGVNKGIVDGDLCYASVEGIKKSVKYLAGEKRACPLTSVIGYVKYNATTGVYGQTKNVKHSFSPLKMASIDEVKTGRAVMLTVINGVTVESFNIDIVEIYQQDRSNQKGLKIKVIDEELIEKTGGIIQGMSGSPIIQNNMIVGAVSHVSVENPLYGYGMHIKWMNEELKNVV